MVRPPWTIVLVAALMVAAPLLHAWSLIDAGLVFDNPGGFGALRMLLELTGSYVVVALVVHGLWRGSRFVHIVAILWQLVWIGWGVHSVALNAFDWSIIWDIDRSGFYFVGAPSLMAAAALVMLLLGSSWAWTSHHRRPLRH